MSLFIYSSFPQKNISYLVFEFSVNTHQKKHTTANSEPQAKTPLSSKKQFRATLSGGRAERSHFGFHQTQSILGYVSGGCTPGPSKTTQNSQTRHGCEIERERLRRAPDSEAEWFGA